MEINESSSVGDQIKYYRQLMSIQQKDVAKLIDIDRYTMYQLENKEYKQLYDKKHLQDVISFLDIEDKIVMNDDYIAFLLDNPIQTILDFRKKNNLKRIDLAKMLDKDISVIKKWETGKSQMTRASYNKLKKCMS